MAIRVGLVGLGMMGATHFKGWRKTDLAEVTAVCDVRAERLAGDLSKSLGNIDTGAAVRQDFSRIGKYAAYSALLRKADVDLVDLCVPTDLHAKMAIAALKAGKHVFCEKPMALNVRQAVTMAQAADEFDRRLMVGQVLRFWPEYLAMKEMVDAARHGRVRSATFRRFGATPTWSDWFTDPARSGSGAMDLHIHDADTVQWFFGPPKKVTSQGVTGPAGGMDSIITLYAYDDIPVVAAEGGWGFPLSYGFWMGATIVFERAAVVYDSRLSPAMTLYEQGRPAPVHPPVQPANAYAEELRYFAECIRADQPPQRLMPADAARAVALVEAEVRSARTGRPVALKF